MKRLLLGTAAFALLLTTACTSTTTEDTNINATDTVNMLPPADNTGPGIEGANPEMLDPNAANMNGDATGGNASGSMPAGGSSTGSGSNMGTSNSGSSRTNGSGNTGSREVMVEPAPPQDGIKSTYKRAAPGDTVDSRTNMGSSR